MTLGVSLIITGNRNVDECSEHRTVGHPQVPYPGHTWESPQNCTRTLFISGLGHPPPQPLSCLLSIVFMPVSVPHQRTDVLGAEGCASDTRNVSAGLLPSFVPRAPSTRRSHSPRRLRGPRPLAVPLFLRDLYLQVPSKVFPELHSLARHWPWCCSHPASLAPPALHGKVAVDLRGASCPSPATTHTVTWCHSCFCPVLPSVEVSFFEAQLKLCVPNSPQ